MISDATDDIGEEGFRIVAIEFGRFDDRVHPRGALAGGVGSGEEVVVATEGEPPDGGCGGVVGHLQSAIGREPTERFPSCAGVADSPSQRTPGAGPGQGVAHDHGEVRQQRRGMGAWTMLAQPRQLSFGAR